MLAETVAAVAATRAGTGRRFAGTGVGRAVHFYAVGVGVAAVFQQLLLRRRAGMAMGVRGLGLNRRGKQGQAEAQKAGDASPDRRTELRWIFHVIRLFNESLKMLESVYGALTRRFNEFKPKRICTSF